MDIIHFIYMAGIVLSILIGLILFYRWKFRIHTASTTNPSDSAEIIISDISKILNNVEQQLDSLSIDTKSLANAYTLTNKDFAYIIEIAKAEVDKSNLLMDKLTNVITHEPIDEVQLNKLSSINRQIRNINSTLSVGFRKN